MNPPAGRRVAVVDCGSNSTRLLLAERSTGGRLSVLDRKMTVTRLGAGVDRTGHLDDDAIERTLTVLDDYALRWRAAGAEEVKIVATSAVRDAADRARFLDAVRSRTGFDVSLLSGTEEAVATYRGATASVAAGDNALVVDIGGGSTELVTGGELCVSLQLGCVRLTERCIVGDPPASYEEAVTAVDEALAGLGSAFARPRKLIAVAGTATTLAALALGLVRHDAEQVHGARLQIREVTQLVEDLAWIPAAQRAELGVIAPGREDVIVAGGIILAKIMAHLGFEEAVVSEADILDGLALGTDGESAGRARRADHMRDRQ